MLKKLKKTMVVAAAAVMLSAGFATVAPKEASAHWADNAITWVFGKGYAQSDYRYKPAIRQDVWVMLARYNGYWVKSPDEARQVMIRRGISDGSRPYAQITRNEMVGMLYQLHFHKPAWDPRAGFNNANVWGESNGIFDGSRGNEIATRGEVFVMLYNYAKKYNYDKLLV
ncbi:protein phosphatase 2C [Bacillus toyonensis]|uniref:protein phosphatase 2C n=1 Tax=Bacillus toyonensis TaxID=155322 RepID=UPI000BEFDF59|nr:protein phosphatase 2C [Bacillus toyonensis]PEM80127.1 protein phosphatase 2C [Bacillus toyonensis]